MYLSIAGVRLVECVRVEITVSSRSVLTALFNSVHVDSGILSSFFLLFRTFQLHWLYNEAAMGFFFV